MQDPTPSLNAALEGRYRIERPLGEGGMATVYLAEDLRHGRQVALKVLRPDLAASIGPERFLQEVRITANLQHPHILALYDSGEADGHLFYVMPYIEGESLKDRLAREGELPVADAARIPRDVVDALAAAPAAGVVHRDIKPANIMLSGNDLRDEMRRALGQYAPGVEVSLATGDGAPAMGERRTPLPAASPLAKACSRSISMSRGPMVST